jgi:hypothetical protein
MVQLTLQVSEELARRALPLSPFLPFLLELALAGFRTPAAAAASDFVHFLSSAPDAKKVLAYHASESRQERTRRLLALNEAGHLSGDESEELDELARLEHIVVKLKTGIRTPAAAGPEAAPAAGLTSPNAQPCLTEHERALGREPGCPGSRFSDGLAHERGLTLRPGAAYL